MTIARVKNGALRRRERRHAQHTGQLVHWQPKSFAFTTHPLPTAPLRYPLKWLCGNRFKTGSHVCLTNTFTQTIDLLFFSSFPFLWIYAPFALLSVHSANVFDVADAPLHPSVPVRYALERWPCLWRNKDINNVGSTSTNAFVGMS